MLLYLAAMESKSLWDYAIAPNLSRLTKPPTILVTAL